MTDRIEEISQEAAKKVKLQTGGDCAWLDHVQIAQVIRDAILLDRAQRESEDTKRLDWLERNGPKIWETGKQWSERLGIFGPTFREAIDTARKEPA